MSDLGDTFKAMKDESKRRREANRSRGEAALSGAGYEVKRYSEYHLFVGGFHYWPSTGLFIDAETGRRRRGIRNLLVALERRKP
jgi:hypothetical protein